MMNKVTAFLESERAIYFLVALFVILGALYSITTPLFEAGDELWHYPYVQWLARGNGLPVQNPAQKQLWEQEGGQPPLYYATSAALTFWIDTRDLSERLWRNPYAKIGVPLAFGNKNMIVHTDAENFPWQGTTLAVHLIRFISVLFSAGTVFLTYKIAREIVTLRRSAVRRPSSPLALLAASFVAFNPMFLFISASVNNDSLAALLATAAIFLCAQLVTRGATNLRVFILGIIVALAILTKVSNLALGIVAMAVIVYCAWKQSSFRFLIRAGILFLIPILVLDAWWFARNYFLYGDVTAFNVWLQIAGGRPPQTLLGLVNEFQGFRISFWGNFGGVNLIAPEWVYTALDIFSLLALIGIIIGALRRTMPALWWIPALHVAVVFIALIRWTLMTYASQGRLMFPAIASIAILFAFGLYEVGEFVRRSLSSFVVRRPSSVVHYSPLALLYVFVFFLFAFSLVAPFFLIAPAYAQPAHIADETQAPNPVHIKYDAGDAQPELVGFDAPRFLQGNELPLKLYWRTASPTAQDLAMYIHVYDARGELIGQWDAFTGNGLYPTRLWQPNEIIVDEYRVPVKTPDAYPPLGRIEVGLTRVGDANVLPARNPQGEMITPSLAQFKFAKPIERANETALYQFGEEFDLTQLGLDGQNGAAALSIKPGESLRLAVALQARKPLADDYTLFAQIVDANGKILAQYDAQPLENAYPTSLWNPNERVQDTLTWNVPRDAPAGKYDLIFGLYRARDVLRLPIRGADWQGWRVAGDHLVAPIEIAP